jgi:adenylate cyclase
VTDSPTLEAIRDCLEGAVPGVMATCAADGTPNVAYLSQMEYIDCDHIALSFQFFNRTRRNAMENPQAMLLVTDPRCAAMYRLILRYLRTEIEGPLFERMKAKLAGIASHTGMSEVFRLKGSDVYRVVAVERVPNPALPLPADPCHRLAALRRLSQQLQQAEDLDGLLQTLLAALEALFDIRHAMVLLLDADGRRLYTVASRGYDNSGVGAEIAVGDGVIGVAARERTPIRIGYMTAEYRYGRAVRDAAMAAGAALESAIPLPGLAQSHSQLAVPISARQRLLGVLFVESGEELRFSYDDEDALVAAAAQLGLAIQALQEEEESGPAADPERNPQPRGKALMVRHYAANDSIFLDGDYLIKGVAGAIFRALVQDYTRQRRDCFSNRELRLDPRIPLPALGDNLEARLILLRRRLQERDAGIYLDKTGRGQFRLRVERPLMLDEVSGLPGG